MKTALDNYARGKQKESNANEYDRRHSYSQGRFICPECGEPVHLSSSKYTNFFSHYKKSDLSQDCDRRIDGVATETVYERLGIPMFIKKEVGQSFRLYLSLKKLPTHIMNEVKKDPSFIVISGRTKYEISPNRINIERSTYLPIEKIAPSGQRLHITYVGGEIVDKISKYWGSYSDAFTFEGALFVGGENGGRKIHIGESVTTDTEYYWVRRQANLPSFWPGVLFTKCGTIGLVDQKLYVYKGKFQVDVSNKDFDTLARELAQNMKLYLLEKHPTVNILWPPVIQNSDINYVTTGTPSVYGRVISGNDEPVAYMYEGINFNAKQLHIQNSMIQIPVHSENVFVSIDKKYASGGIEISTSNIDYEGCLSPSFTIVDESKREYINTSYLTIKGTSYSLKSSSSIDLVTFHKNGVIAVENNITSKEDEGLAAGDIIVLLYNKSILSYIILDQDERRIAEYRRFDELNLKSFLGEPMHGVTVRIPANIKKWLKKQS